MSTEAGRRLIDQYDGVLRFAPDIATIEAEAAAEAVRQERERIVVAVLGLGTGRSWSDKTDRMVWQGDVLAIVRDDQ